MVLNSLTDIGQSRQSNQDNFWASRLKVDGYEQSVICLCDGMGGLSHGELASKMVVSAVRSHILEGKPFQGINELLQKVNNDIYASSQGDKSKLMGTTCTCLKYCDGEYEIWHVGDSRAYLVRDGQITQLTSDHSATKKYNVTKQNNPQLWEKYKNKLTRCIGVKPQVQLDYFDGVAKQGDRFVLCSDGCWRVFEDNDFDINLLTDLRKLFDTCIQLGETDNLTMSILTID